MTVDIYDPYAIPLDKINVNNPILFQKDLVGRYFKRLRDEDPVHYCAESEHGPFWSVTKYKDIMYVDSNHQIFSSHGNVLLDDLFFSGEHVEDGVSQASFIAMDPPQHGQQRKAVMPAVAPKNLLQLEGTIRERTVSVLESLPIGETFDWVEKVSVELTTRMLATLFDFPFEDRAVLPYWSNVVTGIPGDGFVESWEHRDQVLRELGTRLMGMFEERKTNPGEYDLLSMLASSPATRDMPMHEFIGNMVLLIVGGNDTTRNSMSCSVLELHKNPKELEKLRANPALVTSLVPEVIRWQTPLTYLRRTVTEDTELRGKKIKKGEKVAIWYLSGNRDDEVIERADEFIVDRKNPRQHLSFGFGIHRCLGNRLAEMQLRILWEEILPRFKRIEVVGEPERVLSVALPGFSALPVRVHA
jgi:cytochrome P450